MKNYITLVLLLLSSTLFAQSPVRVNIANQYAVGDKFYFDVFVSTLAGETVFLNQSTFVFDYDTAAFTNPQISYDKTATRLVNAAGLVLTNQKVQSIIPVLGANSNRIVINFEAHYAQNSAAVTEYVAKVDSRENYYCLGRFYISGYNYSIADVNLRVCTTSPSKVHARTKINLYRTDGSNGGPTNIDTTQTNPPFLFVSLTSFLVQPVGRSAELEWITQNEMNMSRFEIERSIDNVSFAKIGEMAAKGFQNQLSVYRSIDRDVYNPNDQITQFFYRLKYVTTSDSFSYSPVRAVRFNELNDIDMNTWPNPATDIVNIQLRNIVDETILVRLLDRQGAEISAKRFSPNEIIRFEVAGIAPGVYLIEVTTQKGKRTEKIVVWR